MTYALQADIVKELKGVAFSATSQVTTTAVDEFLTQADAVIDMYVGKRYTTPLTASASLQVVKKIAIDIVVYRITKILNLKKSVPIPDSNIPQDITEGSAYRESMKTLTAIRDNKLDLPDESQVDTASGLASFHMETGNDVYVPCFQKGVDQW